MLDGTAPLDVAVAVKKTPLEVSLGIQIDRDNPTQNLICAEIDRNGGKIPFSKFMELSLFGSGGYYSTGKADIGLEGDFLTSPETGELFGATLGQAAMKVWEAMGRPDNFRIVEMGAGVGAMAYSLLKWTQKLQPDFFNAIQYTVLEYGGGLIPKQQDRVRDFNSVQWIKGSAFVLPIGGVEGLFISNELPDAFPVEIVTLVDGAIKQKKIGLENGNWIEYWEEPSLEVINYLREFNIKLGEGVQEPINLQAVKFQKQMDLALKKGAIITIDYGENGEVGNIKYQAVRSFSKKLLPDGQQTEANYLALYTNPGDVDITTSVNFRVLEQIATQDGLNIAYSGNQAKLLQKSGAGTVIRLCKEVFTKTRAWSEVESISRDLSMGKELMDEDFGSFANYYSHVLLKGISPNEILWEPKMPLSMWIRAVLRAMTVPIKGNAGERFRLDFGLSKYKKYTGDERTVTVEGDGSFKILPFEIEGLRIYDSKDELLFDFSDKVEFDKLVSELGYER